MRYPVRNGRIVPVTDLGYDIVPFERRQTTNHHMWYNRVDYMDTRYKQVFRGLLPHVVTMPILQHLDLHDNFSPPKQPTDLVMIDVIEEYLSLNGVIDCVRERKTNETYQIEPEQWQQIRGGYGKTIHSS